MTVINISKGNTKMGAIPSVSLTPIVTCAKGVPCAKLCYAKKAYRMYTATRNAYDINGNKIGVVRLVQNFERKGW